MTTKKKGMSRTEAAQLYDGLKNTMESKFGKEGLSELIDGERTKKVSGGMKNSNAAASPKIDKDMMRAKLANLEARTSNKTRTANDKGAGQKAAILFVLMFAGLKMVLSGMEVVGIASVETANASIAQMPLIQNRNPERFSKEKLQILKALDLRRVELEGRSKKLAAKELELSHRDREYAGQLTELRELSERLKINRVKNERKKSGQLDQLASVYGSMNPQGAAELMEQLDVTIALSLIERMPEKRIGQILSQMSPERALTLTRMLSN